MRNVAFAICFCLTFSLSIDAQRPTRQQQLQQTSKAKRSNKKPPTNFDWRKHAPKSGKVIEGLEVVSILNFQIKLRDSGDEEVKTKLITYAITGQTIFADSDDKKLTWKAIKKGDYVTVVSRVNSKIAVIILKVS